jgi:hypothetical protein
MGQQRVWEMSYEMADTTMAALEGTKDLGLRASRERGSESVPISRSSQEEGVFLRSRSPFRCMSQFPDRSLSMSTIELLEGVLELKF